jgi:hypothetical protein
MIHSGAIVGAGISQGKSSTLGFDTAFCKFQVGAAGKRRLHTAYFMFALLSSQFQVKPTHSLHTTADKLSR